MYFKEITFQLDVLGMSKKIHGYRYCRDSVEYMLENGIFSSADEIYEFVAKKNSTTAFCVERNIRYAIERTWEKGNVEEIVKKFGFSVRDDKGKPTNREFLCMIADRVKMSVLN